jgi:flagellar hook-associated protein 3 FlgL
MQTTLSEVKDLDYAEAISRFEMDSAVLQASQQSFSKVQQLSLFNYL